MKGCAGSEAECCDLLALSGLGKEKEMVTHSSPEHTFSEVSSVVLDGALGLMDQQPGTADQG